MFHHSWEREAFCDCTWLCLGSYLNLEGMEGYRNDGHANSPAPNFRMALASLFLFIPCELIVNYEILLVLYHLEMTLLWKMEVLNGYCLRMQISRLLCTN